MKWQEGDVGSLNIWSEIRHQGWTVPTTEHHGTVPVSWRLFSFVSLPLLGLNLTMPELWTLWSESYCIPRKQNALYHCIFFFCSLTLYFSPSCIINEFYILIDKFKSSSLTIPTGLLKWKWWAWLWRVCVCLEADWANILNWTMLNWVWKRMFRSARGRGVILQPCQYLYSSKLNVNVVLQPLSGTSFSV